MHSPPRAGAGAKVHTFGLRAFEGLAASDDIMGLIAYCVGEWEDTSQEKDPGEAAVSGCRGEHDGVEPWPDVSAESLLTIRVYLQDRECGVQAVCGRAGGAFRDIPDWPEGDKHQGGRL